jgi:hypothetical protein
MRVIFNVNQFETMVAAQLGQDAAEWLSSLALAFPDTPENADKRALGYALKNAARKARDYAADLRTAQNQFVHDSGADFVRGIDDEYLSRVE